MNTSNLLETINRCITPKLLKNYEELQNLDLAITLARNYLDGDFDLLMRCLCDLILPENDEASAIISSLYILYIDLKCDCSWNDKKTREYANELNTYFEDIAEIPLESVLLQKEKFNVQEIFDKCIEAIHSKLTPEDFKKYPTLIEVFCSIIADLKKYEVQVKPQKVFPVSLLLIDDYIETNKRKGLLCCSTALKCVKKEDFTGGNYYDVIYKSLIRIFLTDKDINNTELTHTCLVELCRIFPTDVKDEKLDDMYSGILDQINIESNIHRKAKCLQFAKFVIQMHKINCANRNSFKMIICNCLDMCTNEVVANVLLQSTLECLDEWIVHCWCIWRFTLDYKMISVLLKVLYTCKGDESASKIQSLIVTLICLCKENEKKQLIANLEKANTIDDDVFKNRVNEIKQELIT